ncbi:ShlB/FhaC/HecB family hemolysin secretion/activation protein [Massilia sp. GCM10020059]|uniref:BamA/TamA family outer membrane protein n=1 Tax=Massilia agrisoli TaxID=2892444 RepID=A0ABS8ITP4_9BURK|nr:ShlB/FhaC/HecB family hemolysin secretion/activation protein [Massilia agrisoli]MCC6071558.1 BamA/TamA family outer membrane protein [Massilia agrisoli]
MSLRFARLFAGSVLAAAVSAAWAAGQEAEAPIRFEISRFAVSGNSLLPASEVDAAVAPFSGRNRDFGDVQRALEALEAAFHARGYKVVTVNLPEQELGGGVVRLDVTEPKIGQVKIRGNRVFDEANVRRSMPALASGATPNLDEVSANLKLANEHPSRKINLQLQSGESDDVVDASLNVVDEKAWRAMLNLDNSGTRQTGKTQAGVVLQHANLWGRDHLGSFQYTTTAEKPDQVSVYGLGYHIPLYALGDSVDLFASYSNVDSGVVSAGLFDLGVSGKGATFGARYNHVLARRGTLEPRLVYGLDIKAYKNDVLFASQNFGSDVTVRPASVAWLGNVALGETAQASFSLAAVQNIPGGSRGGRADFERARAGADDSYSMLRVSGAYSRMVAQEWQLRVLLNGQWTDDALVSGEQFGAGGNASVRGFDERALSTDSGAFANFELYSPSFCTNSRWQCRAVAFYDAAYGERNKELPGELRSTAIAGAGLGLRIAMGTSMNMQLDYGHVVRPGAIDTTSSNKLHVRVGIAY